MKNESTAADINEFIIAAAFAGIESGKYKTQEELEVAVAMRAMKIRSVAESEYSLPNRLLNAVTIKADCKRVEFEDSSKRYKIYFVASNNENGDEEMIRTDRIDGKHYMGEDYIRSLAGHTVLIYKTNEKSDDKKMGAGYRVAPYVRVIG